MSDSRLPGTVTKLQQRYTAPLILELDLTEGVAEEPPTDPVSAAMTLRRPRLADVLDGLRRAQADDRVKALVVKTGGRRIGLARTQELRDAVASFGAAGKLTVAWAETFGESSPGSSAYYLATAFGQIWLQPSGELDLAGIGVEQWFYRGMLDKLGLEYQVARRHEYKSAAERFTETKPTGPAREALQRLTESITTQLSDAIAQRLAIATGEARALVTDGPYLAAEAHAARLVDRLGYRDEVYASVREHAGPDAVLRFLSRYQRPRALAERVRTMSGAGDGAVALIYATGPIRRGRSGRGPLSGGAMGSATMTAAIRSAAADPKIRAILLRVNSPGGSYVASDSIWREVVRARDRGTPVVVSMGDVAASGGYFIAMPADAIVAQPGTITGSIGVLGGKPVTRGLLARAGITTDTVSSGPHADMFSPTRPFSDEEWAKINTWLDRIYEDFTAKVAQGRGMTVDQVHEIARGRVWTGADAHANGLVDQLGGLGTAAALARRKGGLSETAPLRVFPRVSPLDRIRPPESSEDRNAAHASLFADAWGPAWRLAAGAGLPPFGPLILPGIWPLP